MRKTVVFVAVTLLVFMVVWPVQARSDASGSAVHIVQPGETLTGIARWYGVDVWALARANNIVNPNHIYVGQRLTIPSGVPAQPATGVYVVKPGDTLYSIARYYGITAWAIAQANGIYNMNWIYVGQRLVIPGAAPKPTPGPTPSMWRGEYYAGTNPTGGPLFVRDDRAVNFHWGLTSPDTRLNTDQFSVHWTRTINFSGGVYRFQVIADDGVRLWVDGNLVLDEWRVQPETTYEVDLTLSSGNHLIAIDYFEDTGIATIQFSFRRLGNAPAPGTPTPTPTVTPTAPPDGSVPANAWSGEYFGNASLSGNPVVKRLDPDIGFNWHQGAPMAGIPENYFSVRWTRQAAFYADNYAFCAMADDGVRLYVDNVRVIDEWHGSNAQSYCAEADMTAGNHKIKVEYYEDAGDALIYVWWERR